MKISCPICDTSIEVSKFLVGQKGRCPRCASKFLIPESPDDEMEVLERGEIPDDEPEPAPPPPPPKSKSKPEPEPIAEKESSSPPKVRPATGTRGPRMPATGAPVRTAARPVVVKQSSGAFGFLFAIVLAALVGVIVYVMMDKQGGNEVVEKPKPEPVKVVQAQPKPRVVEPVEPLEEPEIEGIPVYAKVLQPVFEAKCVSCHGAEKAKGRLAMHSYEKLMAGSGNGPITQPDDDDPNRIEMIFRAELPEDDEEHMPPQGKPQLSAEELAILKWWIKEGAHEDIESTEAPDDVRKKIEALAKL
jgi:mono/diheme cytochrome c family protein